MTKESAKRAKLRKQYHGLCSQLGIVDYHKKVMLSAYHNAQSSTELTDSEFIDLIDRLKIRLQKQQSDDYKRLDNKRKRLIAAIFGWTGLIGTHPNDMRLVKAIACRASKCEKFNDIPEDKLQSLYNTFVKKQEAFRKTQELTDEEKEMIK